MWRPAAAARYCSGPTQEHERPARARRHARSLLWRWAPRYRAARRSAAWQGRVSAATAEERRQSWRRRRATSTGGMRHAAH
eukprot:4651055-Prymnesium_polylepis.1